MSKKIGPKIIFSCFVWYRKVYSRYTTCENCIRVLLRAIFLIAIMLLLANNAFAFWENFRLNRQAAREKEVDQTQKHFGWWPTDATPPPVKDESRPGYWWWPKQAGNIQPWGNRGYIYVYKIIFDYKAEELPAPKPEELRPSLLIKKIIKNVKIYFDYNKAKLREDHLPILDSAVNSLQRNLEADILITGNCDRRGSEAYNLSLGRKRAEAAKQYMLDQGIAAERIRIVSRGKLDALAPITDIVGMQKDRNVHFVIAEVEELMLPYPGKAEETKGEPSTEEGKYIVEEAKDVESAVRVSTKTYTIQKNDTLWKIAQKELGSGHRWKYLYELNKEKIKDPNRLRPGVTIIIPVE